MKKTVRIIALAVAVLMAAASLASCAGNSAEGTWQIGSIGPTSGAASSYGISVKQGATIAVEEINAAGGIAGAKITFKFEDDQADPAQGVTSYNSLKDWGMDISMGAVTSGSCGDVATQCANDKMFMITPSASAANCIADKYAFRICFEDPFQGTAIAQYLKANYDLSKTKIGVLYNSASDYSKGIYDAFMAELGADVTAVTFTDDAQTVFTTEASMLAGCDVVFLPIYYQAAAAFLKAAQSNTGVQYIGGDGLDGIIDELRGDAALAEGVKLLTPFNAASTDTVPASFVKAYKEKYNATPDQFAADGYDAIYAIKAAIEQANKDGANLTPASSVAEISAVLYDAMLKLNFSGATGAMTWDATGAPTKQANIVTIENGAYIVK